MVCPISTQCIISIHQSTQISLYKTKYLFSWQWSKQAYSKAESKEKWWDADSYKYKKLVYGRNERGACCYKIILAWCFNHLYRRSMSQNSRFIFSWLLVIPSYFFCPHIWVAMTQSKHRNLRLHFEMGYKAGIMSGINFIVKKTP